MLRSLVGSEMCIRDSPEPMDPTSIFTSKFINHFTRNPSMLQEASSSWVLVLEYPVLRDNSPVEHLAATIHEHPAKTFSCIGVAAYQVLKRRVQPDERLGRRVAVRLLHYEPSTPIRSIKSHAIGKFISIKGTAVRVTTVRPMVVQMDFVCSKCGERFAERFKDGKYQVPYSCLLYTSDAADEEDSVDLGGRRIIKKKNRIK
eukprot:TRINITY_DN36553_c0_g1_i1.p1 TRINITY_DN36553_c0_g1~~TRINITY_DN36553_c0_g1_i1.p1  ORF type:complete len:202 (+),score=51.74 TRINITY_DN36553_c0_g1_i1:134-739(+)